MLNKLNKSKIHGYFIVLTTAIMLLGFQSSFAGPTAAIKKQVDKPFIPLGKPKPPRNTCCTPVTPESVAAALRFQHGPGGLTANYTLQFSPSPQFKQQMQTYINYANAITNGAANAIIINWIALDNGTGNQPNNVWTPVGGQHFTQWSAGGNGNVSNGGGNFWQGYPFQVNRWYKIHTGTFLNDGVNLFSKKCANNGIYIRIQVGKNARGGAKLEISDGKRILKTLPVK